MKYFTECAPGQTVELSNAWHDGHIRTSADHFRGVCPRCGFWHTALRKIERPSFVSNHKCDGRCESAKGHKCECACGGKNHGVAA
jgi:hypothetical protein